MSNLLDPAIREIREIAYGQPEALVRQGKKRASPHQHRTRAREPFPSSAPRLLRSGLAQATQ